MLLKRAAGALGAYVQDIDLRHVQADAALQLAIREALVLHEVLFFRDQSLSPIEFAQFAQSFGPVQSHPAYGTAPGVPEVQILESTPEAPSKIEVWHSDMTFSATPPTFTFLHAQTIPDVGGDTLWASATAAWDALSAPMQALLRPLQAIHDFRFGFRESLAEPGGAERLADMLAANPPVQHPVVRTHPETQRQALYVNGLFTQAIEGISGLESAALLKFLAQHIASPEFTVRLTWEPGTLAVWDNRSTQHKPVNDYFPAARKLHRVTSQGTPTS